MLQVRTALLGVLLSVLLGCTSTPQPSPPPFSGRVVVRSYEDRFRLPDGSDEIRRVEYAWDYEHGVAVESIRRRDGQLLEEQAIPGMTLQLTPEELEHAFVLVRKDPRLQEWAGRADVSLTGGFSLRDPEHPHCAVRSRCAHVMGTTPDDRVVIHAIVDLMSNRVVDPHYHASSANQGFEGGGKQ